MLDRNSKVALVLSDSKLMDNFQREFVQSRINSIVQFKEVEEAYSIATRQLFDLFVVGIEMPDNPGITLMQRIRECGNYGCEPFLFVGDKIDNATLSLFMEYDVDYVLRPPLNKNSIHDKVSYILARENNLPSELREYRDAKSAFQTGMLDMANELNNKVIADGKLPEKAFLLKGDIALKEWKLDQAAEAFKAAQAANPRSIAALYKLSKVHISQGETDIARQILEKLAEQSPNHLNILANAGLTNYELGNLGKAKTYMNRLEVLDRTNRTATEVMTNIDLDEKNYEGIAERLTRSHSEKEIVSMLNNAGVKLSQEEDLDGAIRIYTDCLCVIKRKDYMGKICFNLAIAYKKKGNKARAIDFCSKAISASPDLQKARDMLSRLGQTVYS